MDLRTTPSRVHLADATGIYVRALLDGKWDSVDIAQLDKVSLETWLRSRGGENPWAESVVCALLGHDRDAVTTA